MELYAKRYRIDFASITLLHGLVGSKDEGLDIIDPEYPVSELHEEKKDSGLVSLFDSEKSVSFTKSSHYFSELAKISVE